MVSSGLSLWPLAGIHARPGVQPGLGQRLEGAGAAADIVRRGTVFQALAHPVEAGLEFGNGTLDILALALEHLNAADETVDRRLQAFAAFGVCGAIVVGGVYRAAVPRR